MIETNEREETAESGVSQLQAVVGRQYSPDNWAHQALLLMDEAESLIRFGCVTAPESRYTPASRAFWKVVQMLADERDRIADEPEPNGKLKRADDGA